jgi:predicted RNase H-like nuclease (RuvC/YqgF family)
MFGLFSPYDARNLQHMFNYKNMPRKSDFEEDEDLNENENENSNLNENSNIEYIKYKLDEAKKLKKEYEMIINKYTNEINKLNKYIEQYNKEIEEAKKKTNYLEDVQRLFRNKYGHEPYLDTFIKLYDELSKNKNITLKIIKDDEKGYIILAEAGGLNECEAMKLKLLKDMFEHINQLIKIGN